MYEMQTGSVGHRNLWPALILAAVLCGCSKTPPNATAHLPVAGSAAAPSSPAVRAAPNESDAPGGTGVDTPTPELAAPSNTKPSGAVVRADAQSTSLEKDALMAALFPGWKPAGKAAGGQAPTPESAEEHTPVSREGVAHLHVDRLPPSAGGMSSEDPEDLDFEPEPSSVVKLDELHAVLVTLASAGDTPDAGRYQLVGAYFFTHRDGVWRLSKHNDIVTWSIANQSVALQADPWPGHGFVVSLITENGNRGENSSDVDMTLLTPNDATHLLNASLAQSDGASGNYEDEMNAFKDGISCGDLESNTFKFPPNDKLQTGDLDCHSTDGHWSFDGDLIRFNYEGVGRKVDTDGNLLPLERWKSVATYRWENQGLKLIEGKNPQLGY